MQGSGRSMIHAGDGFLLPAEAVVEEVRVWFFKKKISVLLLFFYDGFEVLRRGVVIKQL